mmetsp:Transcript_121261/g.258809  ORF Transcript_121261/g.258809 Transcript_121261/m.258809 type:complete len:403 (+) Transcript_121261:848-2056(+)
MAKAALLAILASALREEVAPLASSQLMFGRANGRQMIKQLLLCGCDGNIYHIEALAAVLFVAVAAAIIDASIFFFTAVLSDVQSEPVPLCGRNFHDHFCWNGWNILRADEGSSLPANKAGHFGLGQLQRTLRLHQICDVPEGGLGICQICDISKCRLCLICWWTGQLLFMPLRRMCCFGEELLRAGGECSRRGGWRLCRPAGIEKSWRRLQAWGCQRRMAEELQAVGRLLQRRLGPRPHLASHRRCSHLRPLPWQDNIVCIHRLAPKRADHVRPCLQRGAWQLRAQLCRRRHTISGVLGDCALHVDEPTVNDLRIRKAPVRSSDRVQGDVTESTRTAIWLTHRDTVENTAILREVVSELLRGGVPRNAAEEKLRGMKARFRCIRVLHVHGAGFCDHGGHEQS